MKRKSEDFLRPYFLWNIIFIIIFIILNSILYFMDSKSFYLSLFFSVVILVFISILYFKFKKNLLSNVINFTIKGSSSLLSLFKDIDIPCIILDEELCIIWKNEEAIKEFKEHVKNLNSINHLFPELNVVDIISGYGREYYKFKNKKYSIKIKETEFDKKNVLVLYLYDISSLVDIKREMEKNKAIVGVVYLDNYDEVMENIEEIRRSLLEALIDRRLNQYFLNYDSILKKIEKDRYIFFTQNAKLMDMEENKFDILEEVKSVSIGNTMSMTLSIGVGLGAISYNKNYEYARLAIDMALGRGGDQAVVKNGDIVRYFGGKSKTVEKNTRVKARVKAHAMRELMSSKDRILIMGHKNMDIDVLGAAIGIFRISAHFNKKAHIVLNTINPSLKVIIDTFKDEEYPKDLFVSSDNLDSLIDDNTMLVVVDVNRPSITEDPSLLKKVKTIVVIDHHRQSNEIIENAVLSYVEPYASSSCEMVAEIVQYISDDIKLKLAEVDAMYAGMVIDTLHFTNQTGVRTFEAAVFLKRKGADITRVRKLFRDKFINYRARANTIALAEMFKDEYAIGVCDMEGLESPTLIGARAANELLDIVGVKASFVITPYKGAIYISARSIDDINVQLVMERLGGGGHRTVAGAQIEDMSVDEVKEKLKEVIEDMIWKGDI